MALPPTIPTSFVPKQPVANQQRRSRASNGLLYYIAFFVLGVTIVGAGLTFGYKTYLDTVQTARKNRLDSVEKTIDATTVEDFIRLRNRIQVAQGLLDQHVVMSQFFDVLESLTLQNVRFKALQLLVDEDRTVKIDMHGVARSFNALAAESAAFASEKRIKRAIFSNIMADKSGAVSFSLQAELSQKLVTLSSDVKLPIAAVNIATTTPFVAPEPIAATTTPVKKATATTTTP